MAVEVYVHPDPTSSVLPFLRPHLPAAATQLYITTHATRTHSIVLATFAPSSAPSTDDDRPWTTATLDAPEPDATRLWIWTSAPTDDSGCVPRHIAAILERVAVLRPELDAVLIGALDMCIVDRWRIPAGAVPYITRWVQLAFTRDALLQADAMRDQDRDRDVHARYEFGHVCEEIFDDVLASSTIPRTRDILRAMPASVAAYDRTSGRADAWCFVLRQGSVGLLYVRPNARGKGLGRATMRKTVEVALGEGWEVVCVEVAEGNRASMGICEGLGAVRVGEVAWARVLLGGFREVSG